MDDPGGELRKRRIQREEDRRSALDRGLTPYFAVPCVLSLLVNGERIGPLSCAVAAYRPPAAPSGISLLATTKDGEQSAAITLLPKHLRALLNGVSGECVDADVLEDVQVSILDSDDFAHEEEDG